MSNWIHVLHLKDIWQRSETKGGDMPLPTPSGEMQRKLIWIETF